MKFKAILIGLVMAVMLCATAQAQQVWSNGSGNQTADALIYSGPMNLNGIMVATDGTNSCTVAVYDNTTNSGTLLMPSTVVTTSASDRIRGFAFMPPVRANTGIYVDITTDGTCNYVVYFSR